MRIIFGSVIWSWYTSLNIKFGVNRRLHVLKTTASAPDTVYRYSPFSIPIGLWLIEAYLQSLKFAALGVRTQS